MKKNVFKLFLFTLFTFLLLYLVDLTAGKYLEKKLIGVSWKNWRTNSEDLSSLECYYLDEKNGFKPIWGECSNPNISAYFESDSEKVLGTSTVKEYKILILGDSNTRRGNFDNQLKEKLESKFAGKDLKINIIKVGIESYNTRQEIELLKSDLARIKPNFVILQFTLNDFDFSPVTLKINNKITYFSAQGDRTFEENPFLFTNSYIYRTLELYKLVINMQDVPDIKSEEDFGDNETWKKKAESMRSALADYKEYLIDENVGGVILLYPLFSEKQRDLESRTIRDLVKEFNLDSIDLLPLTEPFGGPVAFQNTWGDNLGDDIHPTANFDTIVSDSLSEYLFSIIDFYDRNNQTTI